MNFDPNTGQPINNNYQQPVVKKENTMAVIAIVLAALGFNVISLILGILGLKKSKETNSGKGLSIAAIIISILQILVIIFIVAVGTMFTNLVWPSVKKEIVNQATCAMAYDCELNTKSEYICKYKDENNEEKEIKCPWTDVNTDQQKTTTTTVAKTKIKTPEDYENLAKYSSSVSLHDYDKMKPIDFELDTRCKNVGDKVSFEKEGIKIEYTCDEHDFEGWNASAIVDEKIKHEEVGITTCGHTNLFKIGEFYIEDNGGCAINTSSLKIYNSLGNQLNERTTIVDSSYKTADDNSTYYTAPFVKNGIFYYAVMEGGFPNEVTKETVYIYSLDTSDKRNTPELLTTFDGYVESGY